MAITELQLTGVMGQTHTFTAKISDCITARITSELIAALQEITIANGYKFDVGLVEQQRYFMDDLRSGDIPYIQLCGPWCSPIEQSQLQDLHNLTYIINLRVNGSDIDESDNPLNQLYRNYISDVQKAVMVDVHLGGLAEDTEINEYGYDMENRDGIDWYFLTQEITVKTRINIFDPYNRDDTLPVAPVISVTAGDSKTAKITDNLIGTLELLTTSNGYEWDIGRVEQQRLNKIDLQDAHIPYCEVCGPWPDVIPFTRTKDQHILNYHIYIRFLYSDQDRDDEPITFYFRNRLADIQKTIMTDISRGALAQQTVLREYGYDFSYETDIMWYFLFQTIQVKVLINSANPY